MRRDCDTGGGLARIGKSGGLAPSLAEQLRPLLCLRECYALMGSVPPNEPSATAQQVGIPARHGQQALSVADDGHGGGHRPVRAAVAATESCAPHHCPSNLCSWLELVLGWAWPTSSFRSTCIDCLPLFPNRDAAPGSPAPTPQPASHLVAFCPTLMPLLTIYWISGKPGKHNGSPRCSILVPLAYPSG